MTDNKTLTLNYKECGSSELKDLKIGLSEKEYEFFFDEKKIVIKSEFLTEESNGLIIKETFFCDKKVDDVHRYNLMYEFGEWVLKNPKSRRSCKKEVDKHDVKIEERSESNNVLIILESPHKNEYKYDEGELTPMSPAKGKTGKNFHSCFITQVLSILKSLKLILDKEKSYSICFVNPVPFQTSLFYIHKKGLHQALRNKVWRTLYPECKKNFKERVVSYKPVFILNGCTRDLKEDVEDTIKDIKNIKIFSISHPSSWGVLVYGFTERLILNS